MEDTSGASLYNPSEFGGALLCSFWAKSEQTNKQMKQTNELNYINHIPRDLSDVDGE